MLHAVSAHVIEQQKERRNSKHKQRRNKSRKETPYRMPLRQWSKNRTQFPMYNIWKYQSKYSLCTKIQSVCTKIQSVCTKIQSVCTKIQSVCTKIQSTKIQSVCTKEYLPLLLFQNDIGKYSVIRDKYWDTLNLTNVFSIAGKSVQICNKQCHPPRH